MSYLVEKLAAELKAARKAKGLSQRELSARAAVPQSHISKIENNAVDLRISSLAAIAHALDLELSLVPLKALPAVRSISRSVENSAPATSPEVKREFARLFATVEAAQKAMSPGIENITRPMRELAQIQSQIIDPTTLKAIRTSFERAKASGALEAMKNVAQQMSALRNQIAHASTLSHSEKAPRPAYRLEGSDDE
jgi:transcriptional regulator with XRE-family HTH domain